MVKKSPPGGVKSYVKRSRGLGPYLQRIVSDLWPHYGITLEAKHELAKLYQNGKALVLEIGFGDGEHIFNLACREPERNFIGVEVYPRGVAQLLALLARQPLANLRIYQGDILVLLHHYFEVLRCEEIFILFPDPWPRQRHWRRRLIRQEFIDLLTGILVPGGKLKIVTDWEDYAHQISLLFRKNAKFFTLLAETGDSEVVTKFGRRARESGRAIFNFIFMRSSN